MQSHFLKLIILLAMIVNAKQSMADVLKPLWEVSGFKMPESVVFDEQQKRFYVSNVNQSPMSRDSNGSIAWISEDGSQSDTDWVTGLHSPKGLALQYPYLYVADVKELVVINVDTGVVSKRYESNDSVVLNGIAVTPDNQVFVSDWVGNAIYKLSEDNLSLWLKSTDLESPNGLYIRDGFLYVASWGNYIQADFSTEATGGLKRISLDSKEIEMLSDGVQWMNLDGIHTAKNSEAWFATDFMSGELLKLNGNGQIIARHELEKTAADFYYNPQHNLLVVPYLMGQKVVAYQFKELEE